MTRTKKRLEASAPFLVGLSCFLVYLSTMAPTVYGLDSAELTTGAYTLGIVHSPGAPVYLLLAHLFTKMPFGDVGWRVNLFSAFCAAVAIGFSVTLMRKFVGKLWIAIVSSVILAFSFYYWAWALAAELYAPHAMFVLMLLFLLKKFDEKGKAFLIALLAGLFGLALGNHLAIILLLPGFLVVLFAGENTVLKKPGVMLVAMLAGVMAFCVVYSYLPLRYVAQPRYDMVREYFPAVDLGSAEGMAWMISGRMFESLFMRIPLSALPQEALGLLHQLTSNFTVLGIALGLAGLVAGFWWSVRWQCGLLLMFFAHALFYLTYGAPDRSWMYSTTYIIWAIWIAIGIKRLYDWLRARRIELGALTLRAASVFLALQLLLFNYHFADISDDYSARNLGENAFAASPKGAVYYGGWHDVPVMEYLQIVEGQRQDVLLKNLVLMQGQDVLGYARNHADQGRPVVTSNTNVFWGASFEEPRNSVPGIFRVIP